MCLRPDSKCLRSITLLIILLTSIGHHSRGQNGGPKVQPQPYFTEPALSPDRKEIVFVSGGDIWTVPSTGGVAALLVSNAANEARPIYSPDGKEIAFISNRTGNGDIYVITLATGDLRRITF